MTISEIESLDENQVKAMAKEAIEIKGHTVYFVDLGDFGYSALVFSDGRHIYHANDYALHHRGMKDDAQSLRDRYVKTMNEKLFTEEMLEFIGKANPEAADAIRKALNHESDRAQAKSPDVPEV